MSEPGQTGPKRFKTSLTAPPGLAEPPSFTKAPAAVQGLVSRDLSLHTDFCGSPPLTVSWYKDRRPLVDGLKYRTVTEGSSASLHLMALQPKDEGVYECRVSNRVDSDICRVKVSLKADLSSLASRPPLWSRPLSLFAPPFWLPPLSEPASFLKPLVDQSVRSGEELRLVATVRCGSAPVNVTWLHGRQVLRDGPDLSISFEKGVASLCVARALTGGAGKYTLRLTSDGSVMESSANVTVLETPQVLDWPESVSVKAGESLSIEVQVSGAELKTRWSKGDVELKPGPKYQSSFSKGTAVLKIRSLDQPDSGDYQLHVSNSLGSSSSHTKVTVSARAAPPSVLWSLRNLSVMSGRSTELVCKVTGSPPVTVTWTHNGQEVQPGTNCTTSFSDGTCRLTLPSVSAAEAGVYVCTATNAEGSCQSTGKLTVTGTNHHTTESICFIHTPQDVVTLPGKSVSFSASFKAQRPVKVRWFCGSQEFYHGRSGCEVTVKDDFTVLSLQDVQMSHSGDITCVLQKDGEVVSTGVMLHVREPVRLIKRLRDVTSELGRPLRLEVTFSGTPPSHVSWTKDHKPIWASYQYNVHTSGSSSILEVLNADRMHATGLYGATVDNGVGSDSCEATVTMLERPVFLEPLRPLQVMVGKCLQLSCCVQGSGETSVSWFRGDSVLFANGRRKMEFKSGKATLTVAQATAVDSGEYTVKARNHVGESQCSATISVQEPPRFVEPLRDMSFCVGKGLVLSCVYTGSQPASATWTKDGKFIWASYKYNVKMTSSMCVLEVLNADREEAQGEYTCEVVNAAGRDQCAAKVTLEPPRFTHPLQDAFLRVGEPLALEARFSGSKHMSVTWKKDDKVIWASYKYNVKTTESSSRLEILNSDREEAAGKYTCEVTNRAGKDCCSATVRLAPVRFVRRLRSSFYKVGQPLTLEVEFSGSQRIYVSWKKDGRPIWASYKYNVKNTARTSALTILNCDSRDACGKYSCEIENKESSATCSCAVRIEPAYFIAPLCDVTYRLGDKLSLYCGYAGSPPVYVSWRKDGLPIWASYKYNVKKTDNACVLEVLNADRENAQGEYSCEISNSETSATSRAEVTLGNHQGETQGGTQGGTQGRYRGEPVRFTLPLKETRLRVGHPLSLRVKYSGSPRIHVSWFKDDKPIWASYKYNVTKTDQSCELQVLNADREEARGRYTCHISNSSSQAQCSANVTLEPVVLVQPLQDTAYTLGLPLSLQVGFSGSQRIHVSWTKDDKPIWASYKYNVKTTETTSRLEVLNSDREEAQGKYSVTVSNLQGAVTSDAFVLCRMKKREPPHFVRKLENTTFRLGEALSLRVAFRATEKVSVSWRKDGLPIWASYKYNVKKTDCSCVLDVLNADREEARGRYSCEISNKDGTESCSAHVTLEPVRFVQRLQDVTHTLGAPLTLACTYSGSEHAHATWKKDGKLLWASYQYNVRTGKGRCELDVLNSDREAAAGKYQCEISNADGKDTCHATVRIERKVPPTFTKRPADSLIEGLGRCIRLEARVSGTPPLTATWTKDSAEIQVSDKYDITFDNNVSMLIIKESAVRDGGIYTCTAKNEAGKTSCRTSLTVSESGSPPVFTSPLKAVSVAEGEKLALSCSVSGTAPVTVQWMKDRRELLSSGNTTVSFVNGTATLQVSDCMKSDAGDYLCKASNKSGSNFCKAHVTIRDFASKAPVSVQTTETAAPSAAPAPAKRLDNLFFIEEPRTISTPEKGTATFIAKLGGDPIPSVKWMKGKWRQVTHGGRVSVEQKGPDARLEIREVTKSDAGQYRCVASSKHGEIEASADLSVSKKEEVTGGEFRTTLRKTPSKQRSPKREDVDIVDLLRGNDPKDYERILREHEIYDYRAILQAFEILKREKAQASGKPETEHGGAVEEAVMARLMQQMESRAGTEPVSVMDDISDQAVAPGASAVFECCISINYPEIALTWYKGTQKLERGDKYDMGTSGDKHWLKVNKCDANDQGNYRLVCGPHMSSAELTLGGKEHTHTHTHTHTHAPS
uniref:Ig-like domain-containing protein n=1 Tax=Knipowitschia caucasica TaxID=637954 RepID=A0AAV2JXI0_KNICA